MYNLGRVDFLRAAVSARPDHTTDVCHRIDWQVAHEECHVAATCLKELEHVEHWRVLADNREAAEGNAATKTGQRWQKP